jgi:malate dehydrogenase (oxaloacetate-decarboxylating)
MSDHLPTAAYSFVMRVEIPAAVNSFTKVAAAIGEAGGDLGDISMVRATRAYVIRDLTVGARDSAHAAAICDSVRRVVRIKSVSDQTFLAHLGGKLETASRVPLTDSPELSRIYTPGVARVCTAIAQDVSTAWNLTMKGRTVMILSDGTRVLGLGNIGPEAAMPVMEGKAILFKTFGGVDAWPVCVAETDLDKLVELAKALAPAYGAINIEDIESPKCFELERRLQAELDIPVFHDDQHGTAIATLAGTINACRATGRSLEALKVVVLGAGAAGSACAKLLVAAGVGSVIVFDSRGAVHEKRADMDPDLAQLAQLTNLGDFAGTFDEALAGADMLLGLAGADIVSAEQAATMAERAIIFALANPDPEIRPEVVPANVEVMATGRSDYLNQINNALVFPGVFKGALGVQARQINTAMKLAAARALAAVVSDDELSSEYIIPSVFNPHVAPAVAKAVADAAIESGVSRKRPPSGGGDEIRLENLS